MTDLIAQLRETLAKRQSAHGGFQEMLRDRVQQLSADMVDGAVIGGEEAEHLRAAVAEFVTGEVVVTLTPHDAMGVLEMMEAFGYQVETTRQQLLHGAAHAFPRPEPLSSPEVDALRAASRRHPDACMLANPVDNVAFADNLRTEGLAVPDDLLRLLAVCNGFDLSCAAATYLPVFSLLPSESFDVLDAEGEFPRRIAVFQGGDDVELGVYADEAGVWLTLELEHSPSGRRPYDLSSLLTFALARLYADEERLADEFDWDAYFV